MRSSGVLASNGTLLNASRKDRRGRCAAGTAADGGVPDDAVAPRAGAALGAAARTESDVAAWISARIWMICTLHSTERADMIRIFSPIRLKSAEAAIEDMSSPNCAAAAMAP